MDVITMISNTINIAIITIAIILSKPLRSSVKVSDVRVKAIQVVVCTAQILVSGPHQTPQSTGKKKKQTSQFFNKTRHTHLFVKQSFEDKYYHSSFEDPADFSQRRKGVRSQKFLLMCLISRVLIAHPG